MCNRLGHTCLVLLIFNLLSGVVYSEALERSINYEKFLIARNAFVDKQGRIPYVSGGRALMYKETEKMLTDADVAVLAVYLLDQKMLNAEDFFRGLFSSKDYIRCASASAMNHRFGSVENVNSFRYFEDPLSGDNWKNIEFWRLGMIKNRKIPEK